MSKSFSAADREAWGRERARGFGSYWLGKLWPAVIAVAAYKLIRFWTSGKSEITWQEVVLWGSAVVIGTSLGSGLAWWSRERLYRREPTGRSPQ